MKYEFGGAEWAAAMHACISQRLAAGGPTASENQLSVCEVFRNAPAHLADADGKLAWSCVVQDGQVDFRRAERDDVAIKIVTDYAATLPNARFDTHGDPERAKAMGEMGAALIKAGVMTITRAPQAVAPPETTTLPGPSIHDLMARLTL